MDENNKGKGKDVERDAVSSSDGQDNPSTIKTSPDPASITSRLGASTRAMASNIIPWHPNSAHIADALPSHKSESSGASRDPNANEATSYRSDSTQALADSTFKSSAAPERYAEGESNFSTFLNGTSIPGAMEPVNTQLPGYERSYEPEMGSTQTAQTATIVQPDGMDVVDFLNSGYDEVEEIDTSLTTDEQTVLRHQLFEEPESTTGTWQKIQWEDTLNFFPGSDLDSYSIQKYVDIFGTSDMDEARRLWIEQWRRVLWGYTDEVWGDLSPLVSLAKEEVSRSQPRKDDSTSELKALRRLQQILVHVRGVQKSV